MEHMRAWIVFSIPRLYSSFCDPSCFRGEKRRLTRWGKRFPNKQKCVKSCRRSSTSWRSRKLMWRWKEIHWKFRSLLWRKVQHSRCSLIILYQCGFWVQDILNQWHDYMFMTYVFTYSIYTHYQSKVSTHLIYCFYLFIFMSLKGIENMNEHKWNWVVKWNFSFFFKIYSHERILWMNFMS